MQIAVVKICQTLTSSPGETRVKNRAPSYVDIDASRWTPGGDMAMTSVATQPYRVGLGANEAKQDLQYESRWSCIITGTPYTGCWSAAT